MWAQACKDRAIRRNSLIAEINALIAARFAGGIVCGSRKVDLNPLVGGTTGPIKTRSSEARNISWEQPRAA